MSSATRLPETAPRVQPASSPVRTGLLSTALALGCVVLGVAVLVATALVGLPLTAPVVAAGMFAVPFLLVRPVPFLVFVTVAEFANLSGVAAANGIPRLETLLLGAALVAAGLAYTRGQLRPGWSALAAAAVLYLVVQTLSALTGQDVPADASPIADAAVGLSAVAEQAKALLWPLAVGALLLVPGHAPRRMAQAIALTLAVLSGLTAIQEFVIGNDMTFAGLANVPLMADLGGATARHAGPQADANFWGRVLVLGLPFALSVAQLATTWPRRAGWLLAAGSILLGIVLTGSRGALLAAFLVTCLWAVLAGGRIAKTVLLAPLAAGMALFVPGIGSRLLTLGAIGAGSGLEVADPSLEGRVAAQRVALEMIVDHPVLGVGPGNFLAVEPEYLRRLALDSPPLAPHNQYLEAAAEGGLLGLTAWLLLIGTAAFVAVRARLVARRGGPTVQAAAPVPLSNSVLAALAGWAVASLFLHLATFRTFLFVAALGAALDIRARREVDRQRGAEPGGWIAAEPAGGEPFSKWLRAGLRASMAVVVLGLLVLAAALWTLPGRQTPMWTATSSMQLVVRYELGSESPSYDLDTLSRTGLVRTLAGIATNPRFVEEGLRANGSRPEDVDVEVNGSVRSALVVVRARAEDPQEASEVALAVRTAAVDALNEFSPLYGALGLPGAPILSPPEEPLDRRVAFIPLALAVVGGGVPVAGFVSDSRHRRRDRRTSSPDPAPAQELTGAGVPR
ncbi:O-antigen ligase family protein [Blastococcus sp. SYSU DS1021]